MPNLELLQDRDGLIPIWFLNRLYGNIEFFCEKWIPYPPNVGQKCYFFLPSAKGQNFTARSNIDLLVKLHQI